SPDTASELPIDDTASVLRHKNNVILAIPANVRLALPVSHENLLPSERGGSLKGGSLLHSAARRNGRASASLTARGGGLPVGVTRGSPMTLGLCVVGCGAFARTFAQAMQAVRDEIALFFASRDAA